MSRVVFFLIGLLLSVSAILKVWMLMTDPFSDLRSGVPKGVLVSAVFIEMLVCAVLCSKGQQIHKSLFCFIIFSGFAAVSGIKILEGAHGCGCFGAITVPPVLSLLLSIAVLATLTSLLVAFFKNDQAHLFHRQLRSMPRVPLALLCSFCIFAIADYQGGIEKFARRLISGAEPSFVDSPINLGKMKPGLSQTFRIRINNPTKDDLCIKSVKTSCTCITINAKLFPLVVPKGQWVFLDAVAVRREDIQFFQRVYLCISGRRQYRVAIDFFGVTE